MVLRGWLRAAARAAPTLVLLFVEACAPRAPAPPPPPKLTLAPVAFAEVPGWTSDRQSEALAAFSRSCTVLVRDQPGDWQGPCAAASAVPPGDDAAARRFFEATFRAFRAGDNGNPVGLFTGYYEPEIAGSRVRDARFPAPLLKRPSDLVTVDLGEFRPSWRGERTAGRVEKGRLLPYASRSAIENGALAARGLELFWANPVDLFFLQIQGSGRVALPDGTVAQVGFDGQNGHPYVPIGRLLAERGAIPRENVTMQSIRAWLRDHPGETASLLAENPSYVFFRELSGEGPVGAGKVPLTPGRSLAVDRSFLPLGIPVFLDAEEASEPGGRLRRLLIAQDTGGAIRGPVRGDVFWGHGGEAERRAGIMKARGAYYLLLPGSLAGRMSAS
jgi:membrane-bound lytic murein transglycosylase A